MINLTRDNAFFIVVKIETPKDQDHMYTGTGSFISNGDGSRAWLLTAAHVSINCNSATKIYFSDTKNIGSTQSMDLVSLNSLINWVNHPIADMSILEIDIERNADLLENRSFLIDESHKDKNFSREVELNVIGFPRGLGAQESLLKFSPLTYRTYFSSDIVSFNRFDTNTPSDFILLENPSVQGYSGGPVIDLGTYTRGPLVINGNGARVYGIIHGTLSDSTGGKITVVTPIYYLFDII